MAYSKGKISIPNVTGNIVITVTTGQKTRINKFGKNDTDISVGSRINSSGAPVYYADNQLVTGFIPCTKGKVITLETDKANNINTHTGYIAVYASDKTYLGHAINNAHIGWVWSDDYKTGVCDSANVSAAVFPENAAYIRLCVAYQADYLTNDNIKIYIE